MPAARAFPLDRLMDALHFYQKNSQQKIFIEYIMLNGVNDGEQQAHELGALLEALEVVVKDRKWREVIAIFNFPSTATNASYVLRKYYFSLLHLYEQIYFFRAKGCIPSPSTSLPSASSSTFPAQVSVELVGPSSEPQLFSQKHRRCASDFSHEGCSIVGDIDGKFEQGYLVAVTIGIEKLKGVLYHTVEHPSVTTSRFSGMPSNSINGASAIPAVPMKANSKRKRLLIRALK